jgi:hypothetical protein
MRTIPRRTDPLTRATMPAITSTAEMIHRMVSVLPPPFAASIPRTPSMSPPFILGNYRRGRRSVADTAKPTRGGHSPRQVAWLLPSRLRCLLPGGMHHSIGDLAEVLDNLGVFPAAPQDLVEQCPSGFRGFRSRRGRTTTPKRLATGVLVAAATAHRVRPTRSAARTARSRSELASKRPPLLSS